MNARRRLVSIAFGLVSGLIVARIGPVYATPLLIVAVPVVFLTVGRAATGSTIEPNFGWMLAAFGLTWLLILPVAPIVRVSAQEMPFWVALGVVPLVLAVTVAASGRLRASRDIRRR